MWTTALAFLILFMGFITFAGGALGVLFLMFEDLVQTGRGPAAILRDDARTDIRRA